MTGLGLRKSPLRARKFLFYVGGRAANLLVRALIRKGVLAREEAAGILLDEAVTRAIQAEAEGPEMSKTTMDIEHQCAEILKYRGEALSRHTQPPIAAQRPAYHDDTRTITRLSFKRSVFKFKPLNRD